MKLYGDEIAGIIVPVKDDNFISYLARKALRSSELDDLQSLFADEMNLFKLD